MSQQMTTWPSTYDHDPKPDEPFEEVFWIQLGNGSVIEANLAGLFSTLKDKAMVRKPSSSGVQLMVYFSICKTRRKELFRLK